MHLPPGQVVAGRYLVEHRIGGGGMGVVFAVQRIDGGRRFALKVVRRELVASKTQLERFRREAQILDDIRHPGVVSFRDAGHLEDGSLFLVMEHVEGRTLLDILRVEAPLSPRRVASLVSSVASALDAVAAAGIVHRDLKPANVIVCPDGSAKLVDFGVAQAVRLERLTITGTTVGTPRYMAPEQLAGPRPLDARVDQYALGVIAYGALAGRPPFEKPGFESAEDIIEGRYRPLAKLRPELPPALCAAVARAMAKNRDDRWPSAGEFAKAFAAAAVRTGVTSFAETMPSVPVPPMSSGPPPGAATDPTETDSAFDDEIASSFGTNRHDPRRASLRRLRTPVLIAIGIGAFLGGIAFALVLTKCAGVRVGAAPAQIQKMRPNDGATTRPSFATVPVVSTPEWFTPTSPLMPTRPMLSSAATQKRRYPTASPSWPVTYAAVPPRCTAASRRQLPVRESVQTVMSAP